MLCEITIGRVNSWAVGAFSMLWDAKRPAGAPGTLKSGNHGGGIGRE